VSASFRLEALASRHDRSVFASGEELPPPSKNLVAWIKPADRIRKASQTCYVDKRLYA